MMAYPVSTCPVRKCMCQALGMWPPQPWSQALSFVLILMNFNLSGHMSPMALYCTGQSSCKAETSPVHRRPRVTGREALLTAGLVWQRGGWGLLRKAVSRTRRPGGCLGSMPSSDNLSSHESAPRAVGRIEVKEASKWQRCFDL